MRNIQDGRRPVRDEDRRQDLTEIHEERRNRELRLQSRKKRKRKRLIIGIASAVGTLILLVVLAILFVRIGSIDVVGLKYKDKSEVIGLSGLQMDDSIFGIRDKFLRENIEKDPHFIYVGWKYKFLKNVEDSPQGAYDAAYHFCYYYEIPASRATGSVKRGNYAKDKLYPKYAD